MERILETSSASATQRTAPGPPQVDLLLPPEPETPERWVEELKCLLSGVSAPGGRGKRTAADRRARRFCDDLRRQIEAETDQTDIDEWLALEVVETSTAAPMCSKAPGLVGIGASAAAVAALGWAFFA